MTMNRRQLIAGGLTAAASVAVHGTPRAAMARGRRDGYGAAVTLADMQSDTLLRDAVTRYCTQIVPVYELKWPTLRPDPEHYPEELWGIEDPRITFVEELGKYAVAYTAFSRGGPGVALALTEDFRTFERCGLVMQPDDKDAALLPRRIDRSFVLVHRPATDQGAHVWLSFSPDLRNWGGHKLMLAARKGAWWDANKVGLSPPLIETPRGWLMLYHGVRNTAAGALYRLGVALFARDEPWVCLARGDSWIFGPETAYEREGDVGNVVFPCGYTVADDRDMIRLYYGAADTSIAMATASIRELLDWLDRNADAPASR